LEANTSGGRDVLLIRLTIPSIEEDDFQAVRRVLRSGFLVQGPEVGAFEESIAHYVGTRYAVVVSNCTAALHLSLLALDVGPGDRVAVTAYSWPASANVIAVCGAEPVFVDVDPKTFNMDPDSLKEKVGGTEVKAILPVHAFGGIAEMPAIQEIASRLGVPIVEDAACALGASLSARMAGTWGTLGCFSFHPRKAITTGEGGVITTNDLALANKIRALRNHGLDPEASSPDFIMPGYNLRMTEFQAALGASQMQKLERIIAKRREGARGYDLLLRDSNLGTPQALPDSRHVYQSYVVLLPRDATARRGEIIQTLKSRGIETTIGTYHLPLTTWFRAHGRFQAGDFPNTDDVASRALSLPLFESITEGEQQEVVAALTSVTEEALRAS
jgi:dTDP-4-amino-4,6-dideoxygalactose transaminase